MKDEIKIFLISGLGADKQTFDFLRLDFTEAITYVEWIKPLKDETIESYSTRLIQKYKIDQNSILIGLSFGGLISVEISKQVNLLRTIIISSIRNKYDLSFAFKISGLLGLHKLITEKRVRSSNKFTRKAFGMDTHNDRLIFSEVMKNTNVEIVKWGIREIINWKETGKNKDIIRIHGSSDRIFPIKNQADYIIEEGSHMMIVQKASEISNILNREVNEILKQEE